MNIGRRTQSLYLNYFLFFQSLHGIVTLKMTYAPIHRTPMTNLTGLVNKAQPAQDTQDHPMIIPLEQVCYFTIKSMIDICEMITKSRNMGTELDRENPDFPPYLISHGQKIGLSQVLLARRSEVANCVCATLQV